MSEDRVLERDPSNIEQEESLEDIRLEAMLSDPKRRGEILNQLKFINFTAKTIFGSCGCCGFSPLIPRWIQQTRGKLPKA